MNIPARSKGMYMIAHRNILSSLYDPARGLIAFPAIVICTYALLCHLLYLQCLCAMRIDHSFEFWSLPQFVGLSLLDLFTLINVLFLAYLLVFAWSFVSEKRHRPKRSVLFWGVFLFLISLLVSLQVYQTKVRALFGLPDEILSLRTDHFHEYRRRGLEDLILPKSDMCQGFKKPFEQRCTINITRPGHCIRKRRDLGHVSDARDQIRSQLIEETSRTAREPNGASKLILLIRGDKEVTFGPIYEVMQLCSEKEIGIYKIELACLCDLDRKIPKAAKKLRWYYQLPEGRLNAYLPREANRRGSITVEIFEDKEARGSFLCAVNGRKIEGPELSQHFLKTIKDLHSGSREAMIVLRAQETIKYSHIIMLLAECHRATAGYVTFEILSDD